MRAAPTLTTERLLLRGIEERDATDIVRLRSNPDAYLHFCSPHKLTVEEHLDWFRSSYLNDGNRVDWVALNDGKEMVGIFGAKRNPQSLDEAEVGYILAPAHQGKGYAREAVERVVLFCRKDWCAKSITADIHCENVSSIKFAEKLRFLKEGRTGDFIRYRRPL